VTADLPTEADTALYAEVHRVIADVVATEGAVGWVHVPDERETATFLDEQLALARAGRGAVCVVRDAGRVEAFGVWNAFAAPVIAQNAEIRKVMTHPDARGRGLAKAVVVALTDSARAAGVEVLTLDARGNNHAAHALYESLGWVECGRIPDFVGVGAERWDRVLFSRRLTTPPGVVLHGSDPVGPGWSARR